MKRVRLLTGERAAIGNEKGRVRYRGVAGGGGANNAQRNFGNVIRTAEQSRRSDKVLTPQTRGDN